MNKQEGAIYYSERGLHSYYGYNSTEMILMAFTTSFTNIFGIPAMLVMYNQRMKLPFFIANFTLINSFIYHLLDSIDCNQFIMSLQSWHVLDNIGSILCFQFLISTLCDINNQKPQYINYFAILTTLVAQTLDPWSLYFTFGPIAMHMLICSAFLVYRRILPKVNIQIMIKGLSILTFALYFFIKSQDDFEDYLRIHHGMWHFCVGAMSFYMWQVKLSEELQWSDLLKSNSISESKYLQQELISSTYL